MESQGERGVQGGKIQNSNWKSGKGVGNFAPKKDQVCSEDHLLDFILSHRNLVDKQVLDRVHSGDSVAVNDALNQIHWRSLKYRGNFDGKGLPIAFTHADKKHAVKSYSQIVKDLNSDSKKEADWKVVSYKKKVAKDVPHQESTIFISNIPLSTTARDLWNFFKSGGDIRDIILPKKRDKRNKRFGFVKTCSEEEAGKIISNLKQFKGLGRTLKMKINEPIEAKENGSNLQSKGGAFAKGKVNMSSGLDQHKVQTDMNNIFEYTEAEIDEDIETSFMNSYVCYSSKPLCAVSLQALLCEKGITNIVVLKVNSLTFYVNKESNVPWLDADIEILNSCFIKIHRCLEDDLVMPRAVEVECFGLPVQAWKEENLKAFSKSLGMWVSWSFEDDQKLEIHNPCITCITRNPRKINEELVVLVKGRKHIISFREKDDPWFMHLADDKMVSLIHKVKTDGANYKQAVEKTTLNPRAEHTNMESTNKDLVQSPVNKDTRDKIDDAPNVTLNHENLVDSVYTDTDESNINKEESTLGTIIPESSLDSPEQALVSDSLPIGDDCSPLQDNNHWKARNVVRDSEDSSMASHLSEHDLDATGFSEPILDELSHPSLCGNLSKLVLRSKRGRPSRKSRKRQNPFDFKLSSRMVNKQFKTKGRNRNSEIAKINVDRVEGDDLGGPSNNVTEAENIIDTALQMGLEIIGGREEGIRILSKKLESGEV